MKSSRLALAALSLCMLSHHSYAAGLWLPEQPNDDMGMAAAGRAALGNDASTALNNPAAMTRLEGNQMAGGFLGIIVETEFDTETATYGDKNGGDAGGFTPAAGFSYSHSLSDKLKLGVGAGSYFGLGLDYASDWSGRYYATEAELLTAGVGTSLGYKVNDKLSIGAGINLLYAELTQKVNVRNLIGSQADGRLELEADDISWGYNLGLLYEINKATRVGFTYRSEVEFDFDDVASTSGILPPLSTALNATNVLNSKISMDMTLPQAVMFSLVHQFNETWTFASSINWQEWSKFGKTSISVKSQNSSTFASDRNFDDTWGFAVGAMYKYDPKWHLRFGVAYDQSPVSSANRTPDMPLDRQVRYAMGVKHIIDEQLEVGAAYTFMDAGSAHINQPQAGNPLRGELKGDYDKNHLHFFNMNFVYRY